MKSTKHAVFAFGFFSMAMQAPRVFMLDIVLATMSVFHFLMSAYSEYKGE